MAEIWFASDTVFKLDLASNVTITGAAALDTFFSSATAIEGKTKDVTITEPMRDAAKIDLQGTDSGGYQNAEMEEKQGDNAQIEGTLILDGDELVESFFYDAGTAVAGTHTRYKAGLAAIRKLAFLVNLDDSTDEANVAISEKKDIE